VLLLLLLLLEFTLFHLQDLLARLPALLSVEDHVALGVETVGNLRERVVAAVRAESHLLIVDSELLPAEVALVDESSDAADLSSIEGEEFDSQLNCYVLQGEICTDQPDVET
jgi:hypothetical protein